MIGFEVIVNGTKVCVAGIGAPGDLQVNAIWVLRHSQEDLTGTPGTADETVGLSVDGKAYAVAEYLNWPYTHLEVGDEIVLRVVDRESFDPPAGRCVIDREKAEKSQRDLYEQLKRKYEAGMPAGESASGNQPPKMEVPGTLTLGVTLPADLARFRLPEAVAARLQALLDRQDSGQPLTPQEREEAEGLVNLSEFLTLLRPFSGRWRGIATMQKVTPCLWFDGQAEQAARYYVSLLPDSRIDRVVRSPADTPSGPAGMVLAVDFTLAGNKFHGLNGGPQFPFTEAVSFTIACEDQAEVDRLWAALLDGGSPGHCGWLKDRWGLSWQIVPSRLYQLLADPDPNRSRRAMEAMLKMNKLDIAALERAAEGA